MKKLAVLSFIVLFGCVLALQASDVADMAKKERARRDALNHQGKVVKAFTNADVANIKSQLSYVVNNDGVKTEPTDIDSLSAATNEAANELAQKVKSEQADTQANEETNQLKQEREAQEQKAKDAQDTINQGGGYFTRNIGTQFKEKREAEEKIREIDSKLTEQKEGESEDNQQ